MEICLFLRSIKLPPIVINFYQVVQGLKKYTILKRIGKGRNIEESQNPFQESKIIFFLAKVKNVSIYFSNLFWN